MDNDKPKILVIGSSGFIGRSICEYFSLTDFGYHLVAVSRSRPVSQLEGVEYSIIGDFTNYEAWEELLVGCFAVVMAAGLAHDNKGSEPEPNIIAINVELPYKIAVAAVRQGVKKFIFLSTTKVFGELTELNKKFGKDSENNPSDRYALSKFNAEERLRQLENKGTEFATIRLPLVIGKNARGNIGLIQWLIDKRIPIPVGALNFNSRSIILMNEINEFICKILKSKMDTTGIHLIKHAKNVSTKELVQLVAALENCKPIILYIPTIFFRIFLKAFNLKRLENQLLHNFEIQDDQSSDKYS